MTLSETMSEIAARLRGGLVVSCQALPGEPLFGADVMARMAIAAERGGAAAIRANSPADIAAIRAASSLPLIGLSKVDVAGFEVYITPYSLQSEEPDLELVRRLASVLFVPLLAEGRIATPEQARAALDAGAWAVVVGGAITRPQQITQRFLQAIQSQ